MYTEHSRTEAHGFEVTDTTHSDPKYWQGDLIWVGIDGTAGKWLTPEQARALAITIANAAAAATARSIGTVKPAPAPAPAPTPSPLVALAQRVSKLNPDSPTIGAGMLASLVDDARRALPHADEVAA